MTSELVESSDLNEVVTLKPQSTITRWRRSQQRPGAPIGRTSPRSPHGCAGRALNPIPATPETVAAFIADQANTDFRALTLGRRVAAIAYAHALAGLEPPTNSKAVRVVLGGARRKIGTRPTQKAPATAERITAMLASLPDTLTGKRDRALLALGFAGAFRRSELVALEVADLAFETEGVRVHIRHSKTDQEGRGQEIAIPRGTKLRPVKAVQDWLRLAKSKAALCSAQSISMATSAQRYPPSPLR